MKKMNEKMEIQTEVDESDKQMLQNAFYQPMSKKPLNFESKNIEDGLWDH